MIPGNDTLIEYRAGIAIAPGNPRLYDCLGQIQYSAGDADAALETYLDLVNLDPDYGLALEMLARIHGEEGRPEAALEYARRRAQQPEESSEAAALHGSLAEQLNLFDEAIWAYARAIDKNPASCDHAERVVSLMILTQGARTAEATLREAVDKHPSLQLPRICLALALWLPARGKHSLHQDTDTRERLAEALHLLSSLPAPQAEICERLADWRREIRDALRQR